MTVGRAFHYPALGAEPSGKKTLTLSTKLRYMSCVWGSHDDLCHYTKSVILTTPVNSIYSLCGATRATPLSLDIATISSVCVVHTTVLPPSCFVSNRLASTCRSAPLRLK